MKKILFVGAPSSGKTTLANDLFVELKKKNLKVEMIPELVRNEIQLNGIPELWEQYRFYILQNSYENALPKNIDYAIVDSGTLMMFFYCFRKENDNPRYRLLMQDMFKIFLDDFYSKKYDYIFYVPVRRVLERNEDFKDGTRFQDLEDIMTLDSHLYLHFVKLHNRKNVFHVNCDLKERLNFVLNHIDLN
ncbi:MAG: ATP-binding protein [Candidatus Dojkabacteria bacterium]|nr:ATP-binding protein [Candidatus Dojkabacteria bacterium]